LYDTFATTFPSALQTFAPCRLRIWRYHSELERIPLTRARIARGTSAVPCAAGWCGDGRIGDRWAREGKARCAHAQSTSQTIRLNVWNRP
jgi:hypothetical protein